MSVRVEPIEASDLPEVGRLLNENMNSRISQREWMDAFRGDWGTKQPNHGYLLRDGERVVGVYAAIYADREVHGRMERFCNLAAWAVEPDYRAHSLSLVKKLVRQKGVHFTDLTPKPHVAKLMQLLGFEFLDTTWLLMPHLPCPIRAGGTRIEADPDRIPELLGDRDRLLWEHHRGRGNTIHLVIGDGSRWCYVVAQRSIRRGLPVIVVQHISDPETLARHYVALGAFFLFRFRAILSIFEERCLARRPRLSIRLDSPHKKMFKSDSLGPDDIDNLYSELVMLVPPS